jgi:glycosyltransferase involved in cell wall biosynthesis
LLLVTCNKMTPVISVVLPTHNPRADYLARVIEALRAQTLSKDLWELVVVDNGSKQPLAAVAGGKGVMCESGKTDGSSQAVAERPRDEETKEPQVSASLLSHLPTFLPFTELDLSWHSNARIVREEALGLTNARLRGFAETTGEVIVLVDDDNVLAPDYLEQAVRIAREHPFLGTWSGALELELESGSPEPAPELRHLLCERKPAKDVWSNDRSNFAATPWGAGECIRREVAIAYAEKVAKEPRRRQLDLQGEQLVYGGDTDIAYTGLDMGMGMGVFTSLKITHLTPKARCTEEYLLKNYEAHAYSEVLHHWVEYGSIPKQRTDVRGRLGLLARRLLGSSLERKMFAARSRGLRKAERSIANGG